MLQRQKIWDINEMKNSNSMCGINKILRNAVACGEIANSKIAEHNFLSIENNVNNVIANYSKIIIPVRSSL